MLKVSTEVFFKIYPQPLSLRPTASVAGTPSLRLFCDHPRIQSTEWPNLEHCNKVYIRQIRRDIEMCLTDNWTRKCWRNKEDWQTSDRRRGWISSWRTTPFQGRRKIIETHKGNKKVKRDPKYGDKDSLLNKDKSNEYFWLFKFIRRHTEDTN